MHLVVVPAGLRAPKTVGKETGRCHRGSILTCPRLFDSRGFSKSGQVQQLVQVNASGCEDACLARTGVKKHEGGVRGLFFFIAEAWAPSCSADTNLQSACLDGCEFWRGPTARGELGDSAQLGLDRD